MLAMQSNLANTYANLGRFEEVLSMRQKIYSGGLKIRGKEHGHTISAALNYAGSLIELERFKEARSLLRKTVPVARRVLGENHEHTLRMRSTYAEAFYMDDGAALDGLREAVTTLEDTARIARRVLGSSHPLTPAIERYLQKARAALRARETPQATE